MPVSAHEDRHDRPREWRRQIERLEGLPLRPETVRGYLASLDPGPSAPETGGSVPAAVPSLFDGDPGWILAERTSRTNDPLAWIAERPWWRAAPGAEAVAMTKLWRHAVAVSRAARRLALEAGDPDPDALARAGLLHNLGVWALAAVAPQALARWMAFDDPERRRRRERRWLGVTAPTLGRTLAQRWGCEPIVVDATWLHDLGHNGDLNRCAHEPRRLALIRSAWSWAEQTPWALSGAVEPTSGLPSWRVKWLTAEVQAHAGGWFQAPDASAHEERLARSFARQRRQLARVHADRAGQARLLDALADSDPSESPEVWAERAGRVWSGEPDVASARVVWDRSGASARRSRPDPTPPPDWSVPLGRGRDAQVTLDLWMAPGAQPSDLARLSTWEAWHAWADWVADRDRLNRLLDETTDAHRRRDARADDQRRRDRLDALAEFAAGAGHELNNPLAVIVGRAQLLLARAPDPEHARSLQAILTQAQRAHRILRDLMYVARPPVPRPRLCQPSEILRSCVRDLQDDADRRGVRLESETPEPPPPLVWIDPDPLRHLAETLLRNALEATPCGGTVRASAASDAHRILWSVQDSGRGIDPEEARHLFDPFYCGRKAGRGLGLGLPRADRVVTMAGGALRWRSRPGQGTTFQVVLPIPPSPPTPPSPEP